MRIALVGAEVEENLAIRSIASSLEQAGHEVTLHDFHRSDQGSAVAEAVVRSGVGLVGLSMIFTARSREFLALAAALRQRGFAGHLTAGGHFASLHAERLLADLPALDSVVLGEGEEPMVELAASLDRPAAVAGLVVRGPDGSVVETGARPAPDDLDSRPWSRRPESLHLYLGMPIANLLSSRGCYASCSFCSIRAYHARSGGKRFRQRRVEAVADEMAALHHGRGVRIFNFQDDNFFVPSRERNLDRFARLGAALEARGVREVAIQAKGRPDCIDEEVVRLLRRLGLFRLFVGIETASSSGLITLGRAMELGDNLRALEVLRREDVHTCYNLLVFDPESTLESIRASVELMRREAHAALNFCRVEVYGGTPLEARLAAEGRLEGDYLGYTYRIAEPRAQAAYELFRSVFWPRNFAFDGTHFASMRLDYHLHLLARFWPERATPELRRRAKGLVQELNRHSAALMDRILEHAASDRLDEPEARASLRAELSLEREAVDRSLARRMEAEVRLIQALAARGPGRRRFLRAALGAAAAAALVGSAPGCGPGVSHTHMCEAPPPPEPTPRLAAPLVEALRQAVQLRVVEGLWPQLGQQFPYARTFDLEVQVDPTGRLAHCHAMRADDPVLAQAICQDLIARPVEVPALAQLDPGFLHGASIGLAWPGEVVQHDGGPDALEDTHMCEAPPPPDHELYRR